MKGIDIDRGLPVYAPFEMSMAADRWYRQPVPSAWGRHRRTVAIARGGGGKRTAVFAAELPHGGRWRLDYHIPGVSLPAFPGGTPRQEHIPWLGEYDLSIRAGGWETPVEFDGGAARSGWNELGIFQIDAGRVDLVVTDRTEGDVVVADAIRWRPVLTEGVPRQ